MKKQYLKKLIRGSKTNLCYELSKEVVIENADRENKSINQELVREQQHTTYERKGVGKRPGLFNCQPFNV